MARLFTVALIALALAGPARAQDAAIQGVIDQQFDAFRADDFARAFTFASPSIRQLFGSPENFGMMVRQGYPMVWRPADVRYLGLEERNGEMVQRVMVTDENGAVHTLEYYMIQTENGWQINAVTLLQGVQLGV